MTQPASQPAVCPDCQRLADRPALEPQELLCEACYLAELRSRDWSNLPPEFAALSAELHDALHPARKVAP